MFDIIAIAVPTAAGLAGLLWFASYRLEERREATERACVVAEAQAPLPMHIWSYRRYAINHASLAAARTWERNA